MSPDLDAWKRNIRKLDDRFGDYLLVLQCRKCQHSRSALPEAFARIVGWSVLIDDLVRRMRCSKCGAQSPAWSVERVPRPRGSESQR